MWEMNEIQRQLHIINGKQAPDLLITNATYLHSIYKKWVTGNIWIVGDRIGYAGKDMPAVTEGTEIVDAAGKKIVPGYIEPHVHPFLLYNCETLADYAARLGTTTFIADNLLLFLTLGNEKSFTLLDQFAKMPFSYYWWTRFDSQTAHQQEKELFRPESVAEWLKRSDVRMGGELTAWPRLVKGDPDMFASLTTAKAAGIKIEGHFPGASDKTLARMKLLGADGDHEAMTVEEVEARLLHGYGVTLRHSSIRPDLPDLLKGLVERGHDVFDHLMMTTDGATPSFYNDGMMDKCIQVALDAGVPPIDAYQMASYNIARYYDMADLHGVIATGRYASLNILEDEFNPVPTDVLSKGTWLKRNGESTGSLGTIDWSVVAPFAPPFELEDSDFRFDNTIGIEMVNDVITKPYEVTIDTTENRLSEEHDENFLMLIDRFGKWRVNAIIKGFATNVQGLASSFSNTGDIILIGKDKREMLRAFDEMKRIGGGMVLTENGETVAAIPLPLGGGGSIEPLEILMEQQNELVGALAERGYAYGDVVYTFLFLQSTHLPYIRITQAGLYDVMKNEVLVPFTER
ncbi:adenine deaminase [Bacillus sp. OxB-1]|uniref:adenine deaminase C-terminal domain-containing protein n=1 Tax=Bacillus sp. (strain OxB-1) TaxID=98228 RepID=UPI0005822227|nr:adenine deaminase C-terminal domain-containing protein [Bacillus sp. OxB-1]BAQ08807.1 adenine deaminase [Bacillus sp. OxB-1]